MNIFKSGCTVLFRHWSYLLIYVALLGAMGVFVAIGSSTGQADSAEFHQERATVAVVDRDRSDLSSAVARAASEWVDVVEVEDEPRALQDAVAKNTADCLVMVPEGYEDSFKEAAAAGDSDAVPRLQTVSSFDSMAGMEAENLLGVFVECVAARLAVDPGLSMEDAVSAAVGDMGHSSVAGYVVDEGGASPLSDGYIIYNKWVAYPLMCALGVLVCMVLGAFNRSDVRRRNLASPVSSWRLNFGIGAACMVVTLITWAWLSVQGVVAFGGSLEGVDGWRVAMCMANMGTFALFALAFGFLLGQLQTSETASNAASNIGGLVLSFLGGAWMDVSLMGPAMEAVAHFVPTYWNGQAIMAIAEAPDFTLAAMAPVIGGMGVQLLFALALFSVAMVVGRARIQS